MARVYYGVWNGEVYDRRHLIPIDIPETDNLKGVDVFNEGNPIKAFFGDKGFLVFDPSLNLLDALWRHMSKSALESCGKCTPCRMGSRLIVDALDDLRCGRGAEAAWGQIHLLADQMKSTSLCGLGQTGATALLYALDHFKDQLESEAEHAAKAGEAMDQNGMSYMTAPCIEACPSKLNVPRYISYIRDGQPTHSLGVVLQKYPMAATCGRVCVRFCEMACRRNLVDASVGIKTLKRYVADYQKGVRSEMFTRNMCAPPKSPLLKVAVIGAGPGGVSCAYHLLLKGYPVDVFDCASEAGGMAVQGIPSYRLPKDVLKSETDIVTSLGGRFLFNQALGRDFSIDDLFAQGYKSVYLSIGCAQGALLGATGEDPHMAGYMSGIDFLMGVHKHVDGSSPMPLSGKVVVVGGGNVAMDCARSAIRLGASEAHVVYRRTREDMPADPEEIHAAEKEGIVFHFLTNPARILSDGNHLKGVELVQMRQSDPDMDGRRGVNSVAGSEYDFSCDLLIAAIGQRVDRDALKSRDGIAFNKYGCIETNILTQATSRTGVFAGGDCALGPSTLIHAMANGLNGACSIDDYLSYGKVMFSPLNRIRQILKDNEMLASDCIEVPVQSLFRVHHPELDPKVRSQMFGEVEQGISDQDAYRESVRCMRCYRVYSVITETAIIGNVAQAQTHAQAH